MNPSFEFEREMRELMHAARDGMLSDAQHARLGSLVVSDGAARKMYLAYMDLIGAMSWEHRDAADVKMVFQAIGWDETRAFAQNEEENAKAAASHGGLAARPSRAKAATKFRMYVSDKFSQAMHHRMALSLVSACVILLSGLLILAIWRIAEHTTAIPSVASDPGAPLPRDAVVAEITGLHEIVAARPRQQFWRGRQLRRNEPIELASGLVEIGFIDGARVVLEGPCKIRIANNRVMLDAGAIAARVPEAAQGFVVETAHAILTDLGTEFAVKSVSDAENGAELEAHVVEGMVKIELRGEPPFESEESQWLLRGGEAMRLRSPGKHPNDGAEHEKVSEAAKIEFAPEQFHLRLPDSDAPRVRLTDVVAGGDGSGTLSGRGIHPVTGTLENEDAPHRYTPRIGFQPAEHHPLVDGVFIPQGGLAAQRLDHTGIRSAAFAATSGETRGLIWVHPAAENAGEESHLGVAREMVLTSEQINQRMRLEMRSNAGITFDVSRMRGNGAGAGQFRGLLWRNSTFASSHSVNFWIFVDGEQKFAAEVNGAMRHPLEVNVPLGAKAKYLTLVVTDSKERPADGGVELLDPEIIFSGGNRRE